MIKNKYPEKRRRILRNYKEDIIKFLLINIFAAIILSVFLLVIKDNPFNLTFYPLLSIVLLWFVSIGFLFVKSFNRNVLLWIASLFVVVYTVSLNQEIMTFIELFVTFSFLYEIVARFWLGVEIKFKLKVLPWNFEKETTNNEQHRTI